MSSEILTQLQLSNAALDTTTLSDVLNGSATPGTVTSRLGQALKTIAKLQADIAADISTAVTAGLVKTTQPVTSASNTTTIDLTANDERVFTTTTSENTTFAFTNPAASGTLSRFELVLSQGATAYTIAWPGSVVWPFGGAAPDLSSINSTNWLQFSTFDAGTTWYGMLVGEDFA